MEKRTRHKSRWFPDRYLHTRKVVSTRSSSRSSRRVPACRGKKGRERAPPSHLPPFLLFNRPSTSTQSSLRALFSTRAKPRRPSILLRKNENLPITVPYSEASSALAPEGIRQRRATSANTSRESLVRSREAGGEERRETDILKRKEKGKERRKGWWGCWWLRGRRREGDRGELELLAFRGLHALALPPWKLQKALERRLKRFGGESRV